MHEYHFLTNFNSASFLRLVNSIIRTLASRSLKAISRSFKARSLSRYSSSLKFKVFSLLFLLLSSQLFSESELIVIIFVDFFFLELAYLRFAGTILDFLVCALANI